MYKRKVGGGSIMRITAVAAAGRPVAVRVEGNANDESYSNSIKRRAALNWN